MFVKKTFTLSVLVLVGLTSAAHASFEMMLAGDEFGRVHRYDPQNGVYLGNFGNFQIGSVSSVVADSTSNTAYIYDGSTVHRMNYNTGAYLGGFNRTGTTSFDLMSDGNLLVCTGNAYQILDPNSGAVIQSVSTGLAAAYKAIELSDGSINVLGYNFGTTDYQFFMLRYSSPTASPTFESLGLISYSFPNSIPTGYGEYLGNSTVSWSLQSDNFAPANLRRYDSSGTSTLVNASLSGQFMANSSGMTHTGALVTFGSRGSTGNYSNHLNYMVPGNNGVWQTSSNPAFYSSGQIRSVAVVLAPEPGTMVALAGSSLAIILRRRRKSS
jgi:hypothetical protein